MRKSIILSLAALGMLASCSKENLHIDDNEDAAILLNVGTASASISRAVGTGTVGGVITENGDVKKENLWQGQKVRIYMLAKGTTTVAVDPGYNNAEIFNNTEFETPKGVATGVATPTAGQKVHYYPQTGNYDFWGYRLDGAELNTAAPINDGKTIKKQFAIDGSQDIMAAKAKYNGDELAADRKGDVFSAYAARRGVQPELLFRHLLSRLTFTVKAGSSNTDEVGNVKAEKIVIEKVEIQTRTKGTLTIATTDQTKDYGFIDWATEPASWVKLMQRAEGAGENTQLVEYKPALTDGKHQWTGGKTNDKGILAGRTVEIGEACFVEPTDIHKIKLTAYEVLPINEDGTETKKYADVYEYELVPTNGFEPGKSYNVLITIYGREKIEVDTTLSPWIYGGEFNVDPDEPGTGGVIL